MKLHGNAGEMGKYAARSVLPDKITCFLYEYHDTSYSSLALPTIPLDRSNSSVHCILKTEQVQTFNMHMSGMYHMHNTYYIQTY